MARPKKIKPLEEGTPVDHSQMPVVESSNKTVSTVQIEPSLRYVDKPHVLEKMFQGDHSKLPILKSVGYAEFPGTNTFVSYTIHSQGDRIIKIECEEPNIRQIAEEMSKIAFVHTFMMGDEYA